jgi:hypothetical protein
METLINFAIANFATIAIVAGGIFGLLKWLAELRSQRQETRYKRYWELLDIIVGGDAVSPEKIYIVRQVAALRMLSKFPEYSDITIGVLEEQLKEQDSGWVKRYGSIARDVMKGLRG